MAYGDGSFFFTQPVGNGYSGLGSFGPQLSSPVRGRKAPALALPAFAKFQRSDSTSGSSAAAVSSYCLEPGASCTLAEIDAELARVSAISRGSGVTLSRRQTLMGLNNLRNALLAAMATTADQSTMDILMPELPPEDALMQDVSLDIEAESSGIMGWVQDNMLLSAAIAGTVGFFGYRGYRYAKKQGMI
jgi:hypothetical protein